MGRWKTVPTGFVCPYRDSCPHLEGLSAFWMFQQYQRAKLLEHEHWQIREQMAAENANLHRVVSEQTQEIERLKAENKLLHQSRFKPSKPKPARPCEAVGAPGCTAAPAKRRGAPVGHPPWSRKVPDRIDRHIHVEAPLICPHCKSATDATIGGQTSHIQEDIMLVPQSVVTSYVHDTAFCPGVTGDLKTG